jgi:Glycosyltransferase family 87
MSSLTGRQQIWLVASLIFATLLKIYLAATTEGTTDIEGFMDQLIKVRELGVGAYHLRGFFNNPFNHPPPMIRVLMALGYLSDVSGVPFKFWLRFLSIAGGIGSVFILWHFLRQRKDRFALMIAVALCPISIMIDGYHGNTDSFMITFVMLAIYLIETGRPAWLAGLTFGLGCCVKIAPLMFVPVFILYLPDLKSRVQFALSAAAIFIAASLPYIIQDPMAVKNAVFGYQPVYGIWGIPQLLRMFYPVPPVYANVPYDPIGIHGVFAAVLKYIAIGAIGAVSIWMNLKKKRPTLFIQCGVVIAVCLFLTSGFGMQYLVWLVPFVIVLGLRTALIFYLISGAYLIVTYATIDASANENLVVVGVLLALMAWYTLKIVLSRYRRCFEI